MNPLPQRIYDPRYAPVRPSKKIWPYFAAEALCALPFIAHLALVRRVLPTIAQPLDWIFFSSLLLASTGLAYKIFAQPRSLHTRVALFFLAGIMIFAALESVIWGHSFVAASPQTTITAEAHPRSYIERHLPANRQAALAACFLILGFFGLAGSLLGQEWRDNAVRKLGIDLDFSLAIVSILAGILIFFEKYPDLTLLCAIFVAFSLAFKSEPPKLLSAKITAIKIATLFTCCLLYGGSLLLLGEKREANHYLRETLKQFHQSLLDRDTLGVANLIEQNTEMLLPQLRHLNLLHWSIENGAPGLTSQLLELGVDPDIRDKNGNTPLQLAAQLGDSFSVSRLLSSRASVDIQDFGGKTALFYAVERSDLLILSQLLELKPDLEKQDTQGLNVLQLAVIRDMPLVVSMLLEAGANIEVTDPLGRSLLELTPENSPSKSTIESHLLKKELENLNQEIPQGQPKLEFFSPEPSAVWDRSRNNPKLMFLNVEIINKSEIKVEDVRIRALLGAQIAKLNGPIFLMPGEVAKYSLERPIELDPKTAQAELLISADCENCEPTIEELRR